MKVVLISPPTLNEFNDRFVAESEAARLIFEHAPMGILSLAAVLDQQACEVQIVDLNRLYHEYVSRGDGPQPGVDFCAYAASQLPETADVFGFSTICSSYPLTIRLARAVRAQHPSACIILGGPQASVVAEATLDTFPFIDLVVRGEAEETLPRVLDALSSKKQFESIAGITYKKHGVVMRNPNAPVIEDLDSLPLPAFHLDLHTSEGSYIPLEAGRGCPFACSFCSTNDFFRRRFRMKSAEVLVEQMKYLKGAYDINSFDLIHDMFTVDRRRVVAFCEALSACGQDLYWGCSARTDCVDDELIDLMAANGCTGIFFGIDSGSDRMQELMHKRLHLGEAAARIKRANRQRIQHTVSLIAGFPDETKEDLRDTFRFIGNSLRHQHAQIQLHLLAPLAETPITAQYQEELVYDDIFSDISFQGWEQNAEERKMIMAYPRLFPNFYGVPTRWLDRQYLRELREFILHGIEKVRWSLALLHRDSGDLLQVFDQWIAWSNIERVKDGSTDTSRRYYVSDDFPKDLKRFICSSYLERARYPHLIETIAVVEALQYDFPRSSGEQLRPMIIDSLECVPRIAANARVVTVRADYKRVMRSLKRKERLDGIPNQPVSLGLVKDNNDTRIMRLSDPSFELISLCDGSRTIDHIAAEYSTAKQLGVPAIPASVYGVASLARQGLLEIAAA